MVSSFKQISLSCNNALRWLEFCVCLGLRIAPRSDGSLEVDTGNAVLRLSQATGMGAPVSPPRIGLYVQHIKPILRGLQNANFEIVQEPVGSGHRAVVRDPDGHLVEIDEVPAGVAPERARFAEHLAEVIRHIHLRPEMYVGSRSEPVALESVLYLVHNIWCEANDWRVDLHEALERISSQEDCGANSFDAIFRQRFPQATDEQVSEYVLQCWRRISTLLGILAASEES